MNINYSIDRIPDVDQVIELYNNAGLPRPTGDRDRIHTMYLNSNFIVSGWDGDLLVGVARSLTDYNWSCYLADLAVRKEYQILGIGNKLIELTKEKMGPTCMILLLSVPGAMEYYPKVGFEKMNSAFWMKRER
ncbi:MAG: GNAT family N-acetyltransferase [Saprospiraceae bacterium]